MSHNEINTVIIETMSRHHHHQHAYVPVGSQVQPTTSPLGWNVKTIRQEE